MLAGAAADVASSAMARDGALGFARMAGAVCTAPLPHGNAV